MIVVAASKGFPCGAASTVDANTQMATIKSFIFARKRFLATLHFKYQSATEQASH